MFPLPCCAGLDLHKETIVVCIRHTATGHPARVLRKVFGTFADDLGALRAWLLEHGVTHAAMEGLSLIHI